MPFEKVETQVDFPAHERAILDFWQETGAFERLCARGLSAVRGELVEGDVAGYHYYPGRDQAVEWITHEGLTIVDEAFRWENGWGYRHFLLHTGG